MFRRTSALIAIGLILAGCAADGSIYKEGKKFSPVRTILAIGAVGVGVAAAAACADSRGCLQGLSGGGNKANLTGGPFWDWDKLSNRQYRCRNISSGRFEPSYKCQGMPKDDDRWPN